MIRYKQVATSATTLTEGIADCLQSTESVKRKILAVNYDATALLKLRGYIDQDQIIDVYTANLGSAEKWLEINLELKVGQSFKVGYYNGTSGTLAPYVNVKYEENPT